MNLSKRVVCGIATALLVAPLLVVSTAQHPAGAFSEAVKGQLTEKVVNFEQPISKVETPQLTVEVVEVAQQEDSERDRQYLAKETVEQSPEYMEVARVVMAEAGNQSLEGQMAVAQCIRNTAQAEDISPVEVVRVPNQYAQPYAGEVSESVLDACFRVFVLQEDAVDAPIRWFYNPSVCNSEWHESKQYVTTIGAHKFFM